MTRDEERILRTSLIHMGDYPREIVQIIIEAADFYADFAPRPEDRRYCRRIANVLETLKHPT
jgi:hypothetical protein